MGTYSSGTVTVPISSAVGCTLTAAGVGAAKDAIRATAKVVFRTILWVANWAILRRFCILRLYEGNPFMMVGIGEGWQRIEGHTRSGKWDEEKG
jgi:hypothetical protein